MRFRLLREISQLEEEREELLDVIAHLKHLHQEQAKFDLQVMISTVREAIKIMLVEGYDKDELELVMSPGGWTKLQNIRDYCKRSYDSCIFDGVPIIIQKDISNTYVRKKKARKVKKCK